MSTVLRRPTVADIVRGGFATPWDAPTVPRFPFTFRNAEVLTLAWRTDPAAMQFLLPPPLVPPATWRWSTSTK